MPARFRVSRFGALGASLLFALSGCTVETPFGRTISDINLDGTQLPARIQLSDAQVFSREALLNDRIREVEFLGTLIDDQTVRSQFTPQLQRDLTHITTMAAQLGVGFNPAVGLQNAQALESNEALHEIQMQKLEIELKRLQKELEAIEAGGEAAPLEGASPAGLTDPPKGDVSAIIGQVNSLTDRVTTLLNREFRETKNAASPEHIYRDWQAYRAELRADEHAAKLDDIHDADGQTIYRLQFTATILPGAETDKFGITMVDVAAPTLDERELNELYYDWLKHVNARLNIVTDRGINPDLYYQRLGRATGLYDYVHLELGRNGDREPAQLRIAVHEDVSDLVQGYICQAYEPNEAIPESDAEQTEDAKLKRSKWMRKFCDTFDTSLATPGEARIKSYFGDEYEGKLNDALERQKTRSKSNGPGLSPNALEYRGNAFFCGLSDSIEAAILAFSRVVNTPGAHIDDKHALIFDRNSLQDYEEDFRAYKCGSRSDTPSIPLPPQFVATIAALLETASANTNGDNAGDGTAAASPQYRLTGDSRAYAAMPVERAQRLSTVASAANAMQLAMALSAVIPTKGLTVDASAAYQEMAVGTIDAIERTPLVIGFADRNQEAARRGGSSAPKAGRFGWLFGPPIQADTANDRLVHRHVLANHKVLADISLPAWWPKVTLKVHSAWVGSWDDPSAAVASVTAFENDHPGRFMVVDPKASQTPCGKYLPNQFCQPITVRLPRTTADFHALTGKLARRNLQQPLRAPSIDRVVPSVIATCGQAVELLVYGTDLWRSPVANLRGIKEAGRKVLPDMAGLALTFNLANLPASTSPGQPDTLWIVTQDGPVGHPITIKGDKSKEADNCGIGAQPPKLKLALASPPIIDQSKGSKVVFKVIAGGLPKAYNSMAVKIASATAPDTMKGSAELTPMQNRKVLNVGGFKLSTLPPHWSAGESLTAKVQSVAFPGAKPKDLAKDINLVLCNSAATCGLTLVQKPRLRSARDDIVLKIKLPAGFGRIYPGLGSRTSRLGGYIDDARPGATARRIELAPVPLDFPKGDDWRTGRVLTLTATLKSPVEKDDAAAYAALLKSAGGAQLKLRWQMAEDQPAPAIPDWAISLKAPNAGS